MQNPVTVITSASVIYEWERTQIAYFSEDDLKFANVLADELKRAYFILVEVENMDGEIVLSVPRGLSWNVLDDVRQFIRGFLAGMHAAKAETGR